MKKKELEKVGTSPSNCSGKSQGCDRRVCEEGHHCCKTLDSFGNCFAQCLSQEHECGELKPCNESCKNCYKDKHNNKYCCPVGWKGFNYKNGIGFCCPKGTKGCNGACCSEGEICKLDAYSRGYCANA